MPALVASVTALLVSVALMWTANGLFFSLIALRMSAEGFPTIVIGGVTSAYFVGQMLGALFCGRIIEQVGHVRAFAAFASIVSACVIGYSLHVDPWLWAGLRFVQGACIAGSLMVAESWLNGSTANARRGQLLAIYTAIQYLAMSASQQFLHLADPTSFVLFTVCSILFSLALVPLTLARSATSGEVAPSRLGLKELLRISPLGLVGCFAGGVLVAVLLGLMPIYGRAVGMSVADIALFMSVIIFGGLLVQYAIGKASDLLDRRTVMAASLFAGAGLALFIGLLPAPGFWLLAGLVTIYGGLTYALYPLAVAHANDFLDPADLVSASAGLIMAMAAGAAVGPAIASVLMAVMGGAGLFLFSALVCLGVGFFAVWRMIRRPAPALEEQGPYVLVSRTTAAAAELDPRAELDEDLLSLEEAGPLDSQAASAP